MSADLWGKGRAWGVEANPSPEEPAADITE